MIIAIHAKSTNVSHQLGQSMLWFVLSLLLSSYSCAQSNDTLPIYEQEPFDRITLDQDNDSAVVDVFPIEAFRKSVPNKFAGLKLTIRRIQDPQSVKYAVDGKHIVKVQRFQDLLLATANRAIAAGDIDEAFLLLARLREFAPENPGVTAAEEAFFFADTRERFRQKRYDESLMSLDEVFQRNPGREGLARALNNILSQIINIEFAAENYSSILNKLDFAKRKYGDVSRVLVDQWEKKIRAKSVEQLQEAKVAFERGDASTALIALRRASEIWPTLDGVDDLRNTILAKFPRIRVGVTQNYAPIVETHSTATILNWATRRSGPLLQRNLIQLEDFTVDGAQYRTELGQLKVATDLRSVEIQLAPDLLASGHRITHQLLRLANANLPNFSPRWAEYVSNIYLDSNKIQIELIRPTLRPEALLPRTLRDQSVADLMKDKFQIDGASDAKLTTYQRAVRNPDSEVSQLTETMFDDPAEACQALAESRIDIVDRIHPGDYDRLLADPNIRLVPYRLPTIHGLVFNDRETLLRDATFRRGLLYGIDRQTFTDEELASGEKETAAILSGFAPIGRSANDPLGYAYNTRFEPRKYDPSLATVLLKLALRTQNAKDRPKANADDGQEDGQEDASTSDPHAFPKLTLAYPNSHIAELACMSIASNWRRLGIEVTLRPLAAGQGSPADDNWDVLYIEAMIEEPLADLPELVLGHKILGRHGGLVWHAMRQLQNANSLEEVRDEFSKIHRLIFDHTPMLPLWQIIEHAAIHERLSGMSDSPISFYEDVDKWRTKK